MNALRLFTDEDVFGEVAKQLRLKGLDAVSTPEALRLGESDESQLEWAAQQGRIIATFNVGDFARLHYEWMNRRLHHAGVLVSKSRSIGAVVRRVCNLAAKLSQDDMQNRLEYLTNW